jgi:predicted MFS family arabinose efflux permease
MPSDRWVVLAPLFAVRVSTGIQYQVVASLSPQLMSGFVLTIADIGLLIGLYHAPGMILAFPGGAISAWLGDKPVALIGLALMAIGEIAAATAPTWAVLMGARIVAGTGGILLTVMIIKWWRIGSPAKRRRRRWRSSSGRCGFSQFGRREPLTPAPGRSAGS